jgi:glycine cleavage system aminomethyltransferase T
VIGLAWLPLDGAETVPEFSIRSNDGTLRAAVVSTPFYDPDGVRLRS